MHPFISILGKVVPVYGFFMALGFFTVCVLSSFHIRENHLSINNFFIICATSMGFALLGAKILYIAVTYSFSYIIHSIFSFNFSFLFDGGLVFYGGLLMGVLGAFLGAFIAKTNLFLYENTIVPCIPFGHAIGRIGCFFAGCCYGIPYTGHGSVLYPINNTYVYVLPIQLVEALFTVFIGIFLTEYARRKHKKYSVLCLYLTLYSIERFFLEFFRGDIMRGRFALFSTSQWISLTLLLFCLLRFLYVKTKKAP